MGSVIFVAVPVMHNIYLLSMVAVSEAMFADLGHLAR